MSQHKLPKGWKLQPTGYRANDFTHPTLNHTRYKLISGGYLPVGNVTFTHWHEGISTPEAAWAFLCNAVREVLAAQLLDPRNKGWMQPPEKWAYFHYNSVVMHAPDYWYEAVPKCFVKFGQAMGYIPTREDANRLDTLNSYADWAYHYTKALTLITVLHANEIVSDEHGLERFFGIDWDKLVEETTGMKRP